MPYVPRWQTSSVSLNNESKSVKLFNSIRNGYRNPALHIVSSGGAGDTYDLTLEANGKAMQVYSGIGANTSRTISVSMIADANGNPVTPKPDVIFPATVPIRSRPITDFQMYTISAKITTTGAVSLSIFQTYEEFTPLA